MAAARKTSRSGTKALICCSNSVAPTDSIAPSLQQVLLGHDVCLQLGDAMLSPAYKFSAFFCLNLQKSLPLPLGPWRVPSANNQPRLLKNPPSLPNLLQPGPSTLLPLHPHRDCWTNLGFSCALTRVNAASSSTLAPRWAHHSANALQLRADDCAALHVGPLLCRWPIPHGES